MEKTPKRRHLARKFFYLWVRKTFGRVLPSHARGYYSRKTLRRSFGKWKEEWWVACREWKLSIRADCHYRYFLYNTIFRAWRSFVFQTREKNRKSCLAKAHAAKLSRLWAWQCWLSYVGVRRIKHRMQSEALEFRERSTLRLSWSWWRRRGAQKREGTKMAAEALQHWARQLQSRAWLQWKGLHSCLEKEKEDERRGAKHDRHRQMRRAMKCWCIYIRHRREKMLRNGLALEHRRTRVLLPCFSLWRLAWERRGQLHRHRERLLRLARRVALRRAFTQWKLYVALCADAAARCELAEQHHRDSFLSRGLHALRKNVADASAKQIRRNLAHQQHQVVLLRRSWNCWKSRSEEKEEERHRSLTLAAHAHYSTALLRKYFRDWLDRANWERHQKLQRARAERHHAGGLLPAAFRAWKRLRDHRRWRRGRTAAAARFHRETWARRSFDRWRRRAEEQQQNRMAEKTAAAHAEWRLVSTFWGLWHRRTVASVEEREEIFMAVEHHSYHVLRSAFHLWRENVQDVKRGRMKEAKALQFHCAKLLSGSWNRWQQYLRHRSENWKKLLAAEKHCQHVLLGRVFLAWKTYHGGVQRILSQVAQKERDRSQSSLRRALQTWKNNVTELKQDAKKSALADQQYRKTILCKVMLEWRDRAALRAYTRQQAAGTVAAARGRLDQVRLRATFLRWKACTAGSARERGLLCVATQHHNHQLLRKCMGGWERSRLQSLREKLLQRQGDRFLSRRLLSACLSSWKEQLAHRRWEQRETVRALWHWARSLQGKALDAWAGFVAERLRKRSRIEAAAEAYRTDLLREGVRRLLRRAAGLKALRVQLQAQHQLEVTCHRQRAVSRCFAIWKQKALFRKQGSKKRVTFGEPTATGVATHGPLGGKESTGSTLRPDRPPHLQAAGDAALTELRAAQQARLQPRRPKFLLPALERVEPLQPASDREKNPAGLLQGTVPSALSAPARVLLLPSAQSGAVSGPRLNNYSFRPLLLPQPGPPWRHGDASPKPELLPPSSFMRRLRERPQTVVSVQLRQSTSPAVSATGAVTGKENEETDPGADLLSPDNFARKVCPLPLCKMPGTEMQERGKQAGSFAEVHRQLEAELRVMGQKMQCYYNTQQELKSCQRQERILHQWLEMRTGEEEDGDVQNVEDTLDQLKGQIGSLKSLLGEERQLMEAYVTRVREIQSALKA